MHTLSILLSCTESKSSAVVSSLEGFRVQRVEGLG